MNPRAGELVEELRKLQPKMVMDAGPYQNRQMALMGELSVILAEEQEKAAQKLERQMAELVGIAAAQKVLAAKLDRQTNKLIALTWVLALLSAGLLVVAVRDIVRPKNSATAPQGIQTNQSQQVMVPPLTNR